MAASPPAASTAHVRGRNGAAKPSRRSAWRAAGVDTQLTNELRAIVDDGGGAGTLVRVDPDDEHDALLLAVRCGGASAGRPDEGVSSLSPLSSHAAARTRRAAASFESQPNRRQGILETARQALGRYEQPVAPAEHSPSGQYALRCRGRIWCSVRGEMR
jgi:hypothetical protein